VLGNEAVAEGAVTYNLSFDHQYLPGEVIVVPIPFLALDAARQACGQALCRVDTLTSA